MQRKAYILCLCTIFSFSKRGIENSDKYTAFDIEASHVPESLLENKNKPETLTWGGKKFVKI